MKSIRQLISLFSPREKRRLIPLVVAVIAMSVLEIAGIGSLAPFVAVVSDPTITTTQPLLKSLYELGNFGSDRAFLIALGAGVVLVVFFATAVKMLTLYGIHRFVGNRRYTLGLRLFKHYLYQPYSYYLNHNTSELSKNLLNEVDLVINGVLRPAMDTFAHGFVAITILIFLVFASPYVALAAVLVFGAVYGLTYGLVRPRLVHQGMIQRDTNRLRFKASSEAFGAIKDVKILGKESSFAKQYAQGARGFATAEASKQILSTVPSYAMQSLALGFAVGLVIVTLAIQGSILEILPLVAVYAFAVQRLMPNLQLVFRGVAQLRYYGHTVDVLHTDMTTAAPALLTHGADHSDDGASNVLKFDEYIALRDVSFSYPESRLAVLKDINVLVRKNTTVAFVGTTGCGKTTLVDVMMGLLSPQAGDIMVDDVPLAADDPIELRTWQRNFGYVPQQIYLSDDTVAANIAFGVPEHARNRDSVISASRTANLHEFVAAELPEGYDTLVGERGVRLSGGQRQRIGIARALYHDPAILVMDEATSALDSVTESVVMDAIRNLMHKKTIVLIAHRITTVRECDEIFLIDRGQIVAHGDYERLLSDSDDFRAMASVANSSARSETRQSE